jgi:hypothetical protein
MFNFITRGRGARLTSETRTYADPIRSAGAPEVAPFRRGDGTTHRGAEGVPRERQERQQLHGIRNDAAS